MDPIVKTKSLKNKVVSLKGSVVVFNLSQPFCWSPRRRRLSVIATFRFSSEHLGCQGCEARAPAGLGLDSPDAHCYRHPLVRLLEPTLVPVDIYLPDFFLLSSCGGGHNCRNQSTFSAPFLTLRLSCTPSNKSLHTLRYARAVR